MIIDCLMSCSDKRKIKGKKKEKKEKICKKNFLSGLLEQKLRANWMKGGDENFAYMQSYHIFIRGLRITKHLVILSHKNSIHTENAAYKNVRRSH